MTLDVSESPAAPTDCRVATMLPAATPPPLAMAAADIILAAKEEAAIPVEVKPTAPSTTGTAPTATAPPITAAAALAPSGEADGASAGTSSGEKTSSVPSTDPRVDTVEARAASNGRGSPTDGSPARTLLEAAQPALERLAADDIILLREEAKMSCMVLRMTGTGQSRILGGNCLITRSRVAVLCTLRLAAEDVSGLNSYTLDDL